MAKQLVKEKAQVMRKKGKSIGYIADALQVSKSTVSLWCKDISLSESQINKLYGDARTISLNALLKAAEIKRKERIKASDISARLGEKDIGHLSKRDLHMLGLGLYWGEGYKSGNDELGFTNSDPAMIKLYIAWLNKIYGVERLKLICRISINEIHKKREAKLISYWVKITGVLAAQFTRTSFIRSKTNKIYGNNDTYFGLVRVKVRKGTNLRRRILGSISKLKTLN
jgi:hypothetical protein